MFKQTPPKALRPWIPETQAWPTNALVWPQALASGGDFGSCRQAKTARFKGRCRGRANYTGSAVSAFTEPADAAVAYMLRV